MNIINVKTKDEWIKVVKKALSEGYKWNLGEKEIHEDYWDTDKEYTCIGLSIEDHIIFAPKSAFFTHPTLTAQRYLITIAQQ